MSASDVAQAAIDAVFAEFGREAFHNGGSTAISIIVDLRDAGSRPDDGRPIAGQITIEVRKSEVEAPVHGDTFAFDGRTAPAFLRRGAGGLGGGRRRQRGLARVRRRFPGQRIDHPRQHDRAAISRSCAGRL